MIYANGFGVKKQGEDDPVNENTIFQIGSTSKAFTAALVAMMVDEGKLNWKDKVIDYLPDFMMYDPWVTREFLIDDVMAQHSGMPGYASDLLSFIGFDRKHIIHSICYIQPISSFRSEFAYMNNLFLVAAALVEEISGKTWEENLRERILDPLGMNNTTYTQNGFVQSSNVAYLHQNKNGLWVCQAVARAHQDLQRGRPRHDGENLPASSDGRRSGCRVGERAKH